jgi:mRNA interferase RelE/StbE
VKYTIKIDRQALKAVAKLPPKVRRQIRGKIDDLAADPFPQSCKRIGSVKSGDVYRIASGNYRIAYQVRQRVLLILVVRIGHRRDFDK